MGTYTLKQYRNVLGNRIKKLKQSKIDTESKSADYLVLQAKRMAPRKTGATIRGIRKRKSENGTVVESWVPGIFKQNMFANESAPFRTINIKQKNRYFMAPQRVVYGKNALSPSGNPIRWTGTPRFFHFATLKTREYFRSLAIKNTQKSLRVSV